MRIKYIKVRNFLSIGEEPIEIDFTKLGNIVNIKGCNVDAGEGSSNGAGKSTIINALVYGLYGKLIKGLSHKEAINVRSKKGLEVEVHWDDYKVIRKRAPDRLQLWKGDEDISLGGIPATDDLIHNIVKLNHNSFINVACFGQHNNHNFLSCTAAEKRQIAENLLNLDKYLKFNKQAKDKQKTIKDDVGKISSLIQLAIQETETIKKKHTVLIAKRTAWKDQEMQKIELFQKKLSDAYIKILDIKKRKDVIDYDSAQSELQSIEDLIDKKDKSRASLHETLEKAEQVINKRRDEKQELAIEVSAYEREIVGLVQEIAQLEKNCDHARSQKGGTCTNCFGEIEDKNIRRMMERDIVKIKTLQTQVTDVRKRQSVVQDKLNVYEAKKSSKRERSNCFIGT